MTDGTTLRVPVQQLIESGRLIIGDGYRAKNDELTSHGLPFARAQNIDGGFHFEDADRFPLADLARAGNKVSRPGDVVFTSKGTVGRFAFVDERTEPFVYSPQVCFWRSLDPARCAPALLYCWMRGADFGAQLNAAAGQTDMAPYVSLQDQRRMLVPVFPDSQHGVAADIDVLLSRTAACTAESRTLAALRDSLLPRLLSGELRVADAERALAAA